MSNRKLINSILKATNAIHNKSIRGGSDWVIGTHHVFEVIRKYKANIRKNKILSIFKI